MSTTDNKGYYKRYQCRYFDDDGNPLSPSCRGGDKCRFVHPSDPNWPGRKFIPFAGQKKASFDPSNARRGGSSPKSRHGPSLPAQSDLFSRQFKQEDTDESLDLLRHRKDRDAEEDRSRDDHLSRRHRPIETPRRSSPPLRRTEYMDRRPTERTEAGSSRMSLTNGLSKAFPENGIPIPPAGPASTRKTTPAVAASDSLALLPAPSTQDGACRDMVELFRGLAKIASDVFEMTSEYDKQEKKLKTYTEISATLSKVSNSAAASVAPNLAEILLNHAQTQSRLDQGLNAIGQVWGEVFGRVGKEITAAIDGSLESAKAALQIEAERAVQSSLLRNRASDEHERSSSTQIKRQREREREHYEDRYDKRRKPNDWVGDVRDMAAPTPSTTDVALEKLQHMLNEQLTSIQLLTKENKELKTMLHTKTPPTGPSSMREPPVFQSNEANDARINRASRDDAMEDRFGAGSSPIKYTSSRDYSYSRNDLAIREHDDLRKGKSNGNWHRRSASPGFQRDLNGRRR